MNGILGTPNAGPTLVRGVLRLQGDRTQGTGHRPELLDATGRRVAVPRSGANDVSRLAPGVYFAQSSIATRHSSVLSVAITR